MVSRAATGPSTVGRATFIGHSLDGGRDMELPAVQALCVEPAELILTVDTTTADEECMASFLLRNPNDQLVYFKVKASHKLQWTVKPPMGCVEPAGALVLVCFPARIATRNASQLHLPTTNTSNWIAESTPHCHGAKAATAGCGGSGGGSSGGFSRRTCGLQVLSRRHVAAE